MYRRAFGAMQIINIVVHSIFTLLFQIFLGLGLGWLAVERWGAPSFVYVITILLGTFSGLYSMITFVLSSSRAIERLEKERRARRGETPRYVRDAYRDLDCDEDSDDTGCGEDGGRGDTGYDEKGGIGTTGFGEGCGEGDTSHEDK